MPPFDQRNLPFLVRNMLAFQGGASFSLRIASLTTSTNTIRIQGFTKDGPFTFRHAATSGGSVVTENFPIPDIPIMISVTDPDFGWLQGQGFVTVSLRINNVVVYTFMSGLVYGEKSISWPTQGNIDAVPGRGAFLNVSSSDPAANTEASITVPSLEIWRVHSVRAQLVTDGNAANRRVHLDFDNGFGATTLSCLASVDHTASLTRQYSGANFGGNLTQGDDTDILIPIPNEIWILQNGTIKTRTINRQATDNWGVMTAWVEKFFLTS